MNREKKDGKERGIGKSMARSSCVLSVSMYYDAASSLRSECAVSDV